MGASGKWRWVMPGLALVVLLFSVCCSAHEAAHDHGSCHFGDCGSGHRDNGKHNDHHHHLHHHDHGCQGGHPHLHLEMSTRGKLPEELAEEEDLAGDGFDYHGIGGDVQRLSGLGLWVNALGCSLLVSMASLICLITLPLIFFHGKPSKLVVESLAVFGAGAMLGDAFLHQLPHALGGAHSHSSAHDDHSHDFFHAHANQSLSHSLNDLAIGLSVLAGIVLFLLVEKCVRYAEDYSASGSWGHVHHHHHHRNSSKSKKDKDEKDVNHSQMDDVQSTNSQMDAKDVNHSQMDDVQSTNSKCDANNNSIRKRNTSTETITDKTSESEGVSNSTEDEVSTANGVAPTRSSLVFGYLNLFSDGVHNFTDGMALGSAFLVYGSVGGWSRTLFLLAHELPQEVGDFGILIRSGFSVPKALFFNFLSALVALGGTALALIMGKDPGHSSLIEGFTAGGFIYIAVAGVLPEINRESTTIKTTVAQLTALVLGMSVALGISLVE